MSEQFFQKTCTPFDLNTCEGEMLLTFQVDPCNCQNYYQCTNQKEMRQDSCSTGTVLSLETHRCIHDTDVKFTYQCDPLTDVWERCNVTDTRLAQLKAICTNTTYVSSTTEVYTEPPPGGDDGIGAGVVIGLILAGAVLAVILIAAFILYRRMRKKSGLQRGATVQNPEYFEGGNADDPYAIIDDSMNNATYNMSIGDASTMRHANGTLPPVPGEEDVEYDNSAFTLRKDSPDNTGDNSGYTETLKRSVREYETPISVASTIKNGDVNGVTDVNANTSSVHSTAGASSAQNGDTLQDTYDVTLSGTSNNYM